MNRVLWYVKRVIDVGNDHHSLGIIQCFFRGRCLDTGRVRDSEYCILRVGKTQKTYENLVLLLVFKLMFGM